MAIKKLQVASTEGRAYGQRHWRADLTDHEVEVVRSLHTGGMSVSDIAKKMNTPRSTISDICRFARRNARGKEQ